MTKDKAMASGVLETEVKALQAVLFVVMPRRV